MSFFQHDCFKDFYGSYKNQNVYATNFCAKISFRLTTHVYIKKTSCFVDNIIQRMKTKLKDHYLLSHQKSKTIKSGLFVCCLQAHVVVQNLKHAAWKIFMGQFMLMRKIRVLTLYKSLDNELACSFLNTCQCSRTTYKNICGLICYTKKKKKTK